jgi:hypothetical protein
MYPSTEDGVFVGSYCGGIIVARAGLRSSFIKVGYGTTLTLSKYSYDEEKNLGRLG